MLLLLSSHNLVFQLFLAHAILSLFYVGAYRQTVVGKFPDLPQKFMMHCISNALAVAEFSAASTSLGRKHFSQQQHSTHWILPNNKNVCSIYQCILLSASVFQKCMQQLLLHNRSFDDHKEASNYTIFYTVNSTINNSA